MIRGIRTSVDEEIPQWQTIYCSLMLLLVVFFIMLIAYSSIDTDRMKVLKSIQTHVQVTPAPANSQDMNQAMNSLQQLTMNSGLSNDFSIVKTEDGFKAIIPNPVLFASGDATLNEEVYAILDGISRIAKQNDLAVQVEGHTDNMPIGTDKFPSNWELSTMRAVNILRYMEKNSGLPSKRLVAIGFAEYRPAADNTTPEGRQKNRRIEIIFRPAT
jgi:chemotaxis protein MotB